MIRPNLFASIALALVGGAVQAQQGTPRNPQKLESASGSLPNVVIRVRAEGKGTRSRKAAVRDRLYAWEAKLTRRFVERPSSETHRFTLAAIWRRPQREVKSPRPSRGQMKPGSKDQVKYATSPGEENSGLASSRLQIQIR